MPLAIGSIALGRWLLAQDADVEETTRRPVPVEVADVRTETLEDTRELTGTLEPSAEIILAADVAGTVESVLVDLSAEVEPGQLLASLDDREFRQIAAAARAELAVARARVTSAQAATEVATRGADRAEALTERGIGSERARDVARATSLAATADVAMAEAEVARARAASAAAALVLDQTEVRGRWSADAGTRRVFVRHVDEGARVAIGDPLFTLVDIDPLVIVVMASTADYARMSPGQPVEVRAGSETVSGRVARVAPAFDPASRQARVEIEVDNAEGTLRPGMFVRARTVIDRYEDMVTVPETALVTRDGRDAVFVVDSETVRLVAVETGVRTGGRVAITSGEVSGRVVTLGQQRLTDGARVRIVDGDEAAP